jgi:hypothetical protein
LEELPAHVVKEIITMNVGESVGNGSCDILRQRKRLISKEE